MGSMTLGAVDKIIIGYVKVLENNVYEPAIRELEKLQRDPKSSDKDKSAAAATIEGMRNRMRSIHRRTDK